MENKLKISVVTVSYNAADTIEETIRSVVNQTYDNIEYIIIDGGSTDGTVDIIKKYADRITYWVSEPDKGIYDAMNKGIDAATGDYINFMNAGDTFASDDIFSKIVNHFIDNPSDVFYGNLILKYSFGNFRSCPLPLDQFKTCFPFSHPSSFIRTSIIKKRKFNLTFKIVADYNLFYTVYRDGFTFSYIPYDIAIFEAEGGVSSKNVLNTYQEVGKVNGAYNTLSWTINYCNLWMKQRIRIMILAISKKYYNRIIQRSILSNSHISQILT